jgi:putative membrane protein
MALTTTLGEVLPTVNAALNAASALLLALGFRAIRAGDRELHRKLMLAACATSALFLASYLTRVSLTGTHRFPGEGWLRAAYLTLLTIHTVLAAVVAPMVLRTVWLPLRARYAEHRRIARWTFPTWMIVSVTGVAVYAMLYHVAPGR